MVRVWYRDDQLNFLKFTDIVTNDFPKALRQTFRLMWDRKFGPVLWDDSEAVRKLFRAKEGGTTKVPTHQSYEEWDCTALFQATIFAQSFALPDRTSHYKTLSDLYVKPLGLPRGSFHASVVSSGGDYYETVALAIDQLRLLRNSLSHPAKGEMSKRTFNQYLQLVKDTFKALGLKTDKIDAISSESGFPTSEVADLKRKIQNRNMAIVGLGIGVGLL
ncbi:unnamed protein product [Porites evermanni]|uniref:Uncharacterized protein n=1 Tax=Porites evermanni TaxID=104178 RepID=A0ABN8S1N7_9CNID|nr:unnamed protein product [Porites evermanni]